MGEGALDGRKEIVEGLTGWWTRRVEGGEGCVEKYEKVRDSQKEIVLV